jgi:hypothetical protein
VPRYYLDTSAQIERNGGLKRDLIKEKLRGRTHATSTHVEREWNRFVFESSVALRKALASSGNRQDIVGHMRKGFGRQPSRNWQVTEWVMGAETDLRVVEKRLADFVRIRARAMFNAQVDEVRDGTECGIVGRRPYQRYGVWRYDPMCQKTEVICRQPEFLTAELERARAAAEALEGSPRTEDADMGRKATQALADTSGNATKGKACHGAKGLGGDVCIALECAPDEVLLTTDESFALICPALGLEHERL